MVASTFHVRISPRNKIINKSFGVGVHGGGGGGSIGPMDYLACKIVPVVNGLFQGPLNKCQLSQLAVGVNTSTGIFEN